MPLKYLLISGSPRKGNTDFILSEIYKTIKQDKEIIFLKNKKIKHCLGCLSCDYKPQCAIKDDMDEIRDKMLNADVIIIGAPNYFDNVSGLLKDFIDRTHPFYKEKLLKGKKLFLIMVGGGDVKISEKYLNMTMRGFVKHLEFNLIKSYCFKALNPKDVEQDFSSVKKISKIAREIKIIKKGRV